MSVGDFAWSSIFLLLAVSTLTFNRRRYGDHLTPLGLFIGVNSVAVCCLHFNLLNFTRVHLETHLVILAGMTAFILAVVVKLPGGIKRASLDRDDTRSLNPLFYAIVSLAVSGWIISLYFMSSKYGLAYLIANTWILELEFQLQYVGYLNMFGILVLPMYVIRRTCGMAHRIDLLLVILALVGLLLAGIKQYVIFSSVSAVVAYSVMRPGRIGLRHALVGFAVIIGFFVAYNELVDVFVRQSFSDSRFPVALQFLERPYLYLTGSWPAMDRLVMDHALQEPVFGYITLQPLWKLLGDGLHLIDPVNRFLPSVEIGPQDFNVFSFFGEVYWDYGVPGVAVFSFVLGWVGASLYLKAVTSGRWGFVLLYAIFSYGLVVSFFAYYYRFEMLVLLGLIALLMYVVSPLIARNLNHAG